jgi:hypothetical protein
MPVIIKALINQAAFLALHYAYDFFPTTLVSLFSGINESIFQHMKIGFFAFILTNLIESIFNKNNANLRNFIVARIFSTVLLPWIMFLLYFLPEAVFGKVDNLVVEIIMANIVLLFTSILTILIERHIEQIQPTKRFFWVSITLFLTAGFLFIVYTFRLPWFDVFAIPPGWE